MRKFSLFILQLIFSVLCPTVLLAQETGFRKITFPEYRSPSSWIQSGNQIINIIENTVSKIPTASKFNELVDAHNESVELLQQNLEIIRTRSTIRNFYNLRNQIGLLIEKTQKQQNKIKGVSEELFYYVDIINKLKNDTLNYYVHHDSLISRVYIIEADLLIKRMEFADSLCLSKLKNYSVVENDFNNIIQSAIKINNQVNENIVFVKQHLFSSDEPTFLKLNQKEYPHFYSILKQTAKEKYHLLYNYSKASLFSLFLFRLIIMLFVIIPLIYIKKIYVKKIPTIYTENLKYVHKYTALMAPAVFLCFAPMIFHFPPLLLLDLFFITIVFMVMIILVKDFHTLNKKFVFLLLLYYVVLKFVNFFIEVTLIERMLFAGSIGLLPLSFHFLKWINKNLVKYKFILSTIIYIVSFLILLGFIFNCTGNFILSKIVILAALDAFFLIIMLYFVIIGIGDYIFILGDYLYRSNKSFKPDLYSFYLGLKPYLIFFAFIYWIASLLINIELFDPFVNILGDFLQKPRYASNFIFTFSNVAGFILYIGGSFLISNLLKPLFTTNNQQASHEHSNWANYIFLIRFVIISTGFVLALSSAGIPLSTITVVLGAVGVGIGFGLQNIFNNLFSGLLIAFERPFKVGDVLSIPEGLGKVKEIGLRSSIIFTNNGSEIVVPNGDLISNSFTNWTLSNSNTKLTIQVPVSRDTEIDVMKNILHESINEIKGVMLDIKPEINITSITSNSLIFELECWISDILLLEETKSAIYENLVQLMLKNNIKSPAKISTDSLRDS